MVRLVNGRIRGEVAWLRGTHDAGLRESWDDVLSDSQHVNAFLRDQLSLEISVQACVQTILKHTGRI